MTQTFDRELRVFIHKWLRKAKSDLGFQWNSKIEEVINNQLSLKHYLEDTSNERIVSENYLSDQSKFVKPTLVSHEIINQIVIFLEKRYPKFRGELENLIEIKNKSEPSENDELHSEVIFDEDEHGSDFSSQNRNVTWILQAWNWKGYRRLLTIFIPICVFGGISFGVYLFRPNLDVPKDVGHEGRDETIKPKPRLSSQRIVPEVVAPTPPQPSLTELASIEIQAPDTIRAMALSPDSHLLALASDDWSIEVFYTETGLKAASFTGHEGQIESLAFSPDGKLIASGSTDGNAIIWSLDTGAMHRTFPGETRIKSDKPMPKVVAFSPTGEYIATNVTGAKVQVISVADGAIRGEFIIRESREQIDEKIKKKFEQYPEPEYSGSPQRLDVSRELYDAMKNYQKGQSNMRQPIEALAFSPDGAQIASISYGSESDVQITDWRTGRRITSYQFRDLKSDDYDAGFHPRQLIFSPSSMVVGIWGHHKIGPERRSFTEVYLWRIADKILPKQVYRSRGAPYRGSIDYSTDGRYLIFLQEYGFVVYDIAEGSVAKQVRDNNGRNFTQISGKSPFLIAYDKHTNKAIIERFP